MLRSSTALSLIATLSLSTAAFAQEGEGAPADDCALWVSYAIPPDTLSPVVTEGVFTIPAEGARDCGDGNLEGSFTITVEDDDGPIPGRVTRYESETRNVVAWAPEANAERRPTTAKNARATVRFYTTFSWEMNGPTEAYEEGTFTLDVATDPTPDPTPPVITDVRAQLSVQDMWSESSSPCHRAEITMSWTNADQPPGTGEVSSVTVSEANPEGSTSNHRIGTNGAITRTYSGYADRYCLTPAVARGWIDDRQAAADAICYPHADFVALLGDGQRLCYGPDDAGAGGAMTGEGGAASEDDDDDGGCDAVGGGPADLGWLGLILAFGLTRRRHLSAAEARAPRCEGRTHRIETLVADHCGPVTASPKSFDTVLCEEAPIYDTALFHDGGWVCRFAADDADTRSAIADFDRIQCQGPDDCRFDPMVPA